MNLAELKAALDISCPVLLVNPKTGANYLALGIGYNLEGEEKAVMLPIDIGEIDKLNKVYHLTIRDKEQKSGREQS